MSALGWLKDKADDVKDAVTDAVGWGQDVAGQAWDWAKNQAQDEFPFLGQGGQSGPSSTSSTASATQSTTVYCGAGCGGTSVADQRRYHLEGGFLLDTFTGRVWRYDEGSKMFNRIPRALSETEIDAVEIAHGLFQSMAENFKNRVDHHGEGAGATLAPILDRLVASGKRDIERHRRLSGTTPVQAKR